MASFDFSPFSAVLLDLDGTLSHEQQALPGARQLVDRLRREERKYAVLSNTTSSPAQIVDRLNHMGMSIPVDRIYTAAAAAVDHVLEKFGPNPRVFNLATEGISQLLSAQAHWVQLPDEDCDAVICGSPANVHATADRQRIAMMLLRAGAHLVGICGDRVYTSPRGLEIGVGALTRLLCYSANVTATFAGKPQKLFFDHLCQRLDVRPDQCVLIGDNLESDVAGAAALGMKTILPLTGVTTMDEIDRQPVSRRPQWIVNDLTQLL